MSNDQRLVRTVWSVSKYVDMVFRCTQLVSLGRAPSRVGHVIWGEGQALCLFESTRASDADGKVCVWGAVRVCQDETNTQT